MPIYPGDFTPYLTELVGRVVRVLGTSWEESSRSGVVEETLYLLRLPLSIWDYVRVSE